MTGGTVKSEPGFSPALDAEFIGTGNDYIHNDPSGKTMRLNAHGIVKDKKSGAKVYLHYTGVVNITPELGAVLQGKKDAKSTEFGDSCESSWHDLWIIVFPVVCHLLMKTLHIQVTEIRFETGDEDLKPLESGVFVTAGRFIYEHGKPVVVEYKVSKVVKGGN